MSAQSPAVRTGAYARSKTALKIRADKTRRLMRKLRDVCPWLKESDLPVLRAYCELEVIGASLFAGVMEAGAITSAGKSDVAARRLVEDHRKNRLAAARLASDLGLTPLARRAIESGSRGAVFDLAGAFAAEDVAERAIAVAEERQKERDASDSEK